jgi:hypothetical protein
MRTILYILSFSFFMLFTGRSQDVQFTAAATPNVIRVGEQFNLTYTSNQEISSLDLPDLNDFELLGGPSQSHSQSVYTVNGKITATSTYQFTYFFRALKEGKFNIPAATARIKNKTYQSNTTNIEVITGSGQAGQQAQGANATEPEQAEVTGDKDIFVSLILDKKTAYLGEQIMATVKIYTKKSLSAVDQSFKGPDFTGFFTEPVDVPQLRNLQREAINNDIYYTGVLRKFVIMPQKTGEITIQPFDLDVAMRQEVRRRFADPFFDDFDIPEVQQIPVKLKSKAVKINVRPLPPDAPVSFTGAVGSFNMKSSLNKTTTRTNEPLTLKLAISGKGNIKLINEVNVNVPYDMEKYDPVINTHLDNPLSGTKTFEYMLVPRIAGSYTIPQIEFTYFDPSSNQYKTLQTLAYTVQVEQGQGDSLMAVVPGMSKEDVKLLNQDIRFIKSKPVRLLKKTVYLAQSPFYYLLYLFALAVFIAVILIRNSYIRKNADIIGVRLRKADKYARKRLKRSEALLKQGDHAGFYEELLGATWGYLSDKLKIPVAELSKDTARGALLEHAVDEQLIDDLFRITSECEVARYSQASGSISMDKLYHDALQIISTLQQKLR